MPAMVFPDSGENIALEALTNKTAPQNLVLKLFKNNVTPDENSTAATFQEATFPGYAPITLAGADWASAAGGSIQTSAQKSWTCSGASIDDIYGYFIVQEVSGTLVCAKRDDNAPLAVRNSGDIVRITPTITAS